LLLHGVRLPFLVARDETLRALGLRVEVWFTASPTTKPAAPPDGRALGLVVTVVGARRRRPRRLLRGRHEIAGAAAESGPPSRSPTPAAPGEAGARARRGRGLEKPRLSRRRCMRVLRLRFRVRRW
jgi:hypothetical protein